jgi:polyisoprenoid-binding protein YceI
VLLLCLLAAACAPGTTPEAQSQSETPRASLPTSVATTPATSQPRPAIATPPDGCATGFRVRSGSIVVRITERIGPFPVHEAVIEGDTVTGGFVFGGAGRFDACSAVVADLRRLRSTDSVPGEDMRSRDEKIHEDFLETERYPHAVVTLAGVAGIPDPLPARGEWNATISGDLTLHGRTRPVEWSVHASRSATALDATATTSVTFEDFDIFRPTQFLSLAERIRIEVRIAAELR